MNRNTKEYSTRIHAISQREIMSFKEAVDYLGVSESTLYKLTSKNLIRFTKPNGGKLYFQRCDLDKWMLTNASPTNEELENQMFNHLNKNGNG